MFDKKGMLPVQMKVLEPVLKAIKKREASLDKSTAKLITQYKDAETNVQKCEALDRLAPQLIDMVQCEAEILATFYPEEGNPMVVRIEELKRQNAAIVYSRDRVYWLKQNLTEFGSALLKAANGASGSVYIETLQENVQAILAAVSIVMENRI